MIPTEAQQLCTFYVGDLYFGVDVRVVQEIIRYQEMTPVPLSSKCVKGLINLRGQIVTAVDMRVRLGLPPRPEEDLPINVVLRTGDEVTSLLVDEIGDVLDLDPERFEPPPETIDDMTRALARGVFKLDGRLLLLLDPERAVSVNGKPIAA